MFPTIRFSPAELESGSIHENTLREAAEIFNANGCLLIENAFTPEFIANLHASYLRRYKRYFNDRDYSDAHEVAPLRYQVTVEVEPPFNDPYLYAHPLILPIFQQILGKRCALDGIGSMVALPGAREQLDHRDNPGLFGDEDIDTGLPTYAITFYVPLIKLDEAVGTTRMWMGSHLKFDREKDGTFVAEDPLGPVGACYLMDYRLLHKGLANRSDLVRPVMYLVYKRPWWSDISSYRKQEGVKISESEYLKVPEAYRAMFPRKLIWWRQQLQQFSKKSLKRRYRRNPVLRFAKNVVDPYLHKR